MANPPFNVDRVDKDRLKDDPRFPFGLPGGQRQLPLDSAFLQRPERHRPSRIRHGQLRRDARGSELDIRKKLIEARPWT